MVISAHSPALKPSVGSEARKLRNSLGMTQEELASNAGIPVKDVSLLERDLPLARDRSLTILRELWAREVYSRFS